jgi:hypothetical protein
MKARLANLALSLALLAAVFAVALAAREYRRANLPEPEHCALCGREYVCHAPALLNLATGEIASLEIYAFDPFLPDEIDKSRTGFMQLKTGAGVQVCMDAGRSASVILPDKVEPMDYSLYCRSCRALLSEAGTRGYVLLDRHDPDTLAVYPTRLGTVCFINGYRATVEKKTISAIPEGQKEIVQVIVTAAE